MACFKILENNFENLRNMIKKYNLKLNKNVKMNPGLLTFYELITLSIFIIFLLNKSNYYPTRNGTATSVNCCQSCAVLILTARVFSTELYTHVTAARKLIIMI